MEQRERPNDKAKKFLAGVLRHGTITNADGTSSFGANNWAPEKRGFQLRGGKKGAHAGKKAFGGSTVHDLQ